MEWIVGILIIVFVAWAFLKQPSGKDYNYRQNSPLFTPAERSFLGVLDQAISDKYRVFGKVRVADVLAPVKGISRKNWQIAFNKISRKHFDYVLCSKDKLEVIAVIELDDKSHNTKKSNNRDSFLENACKSASLTLVRFHAKSNYQINNVRGQIELALNQK